MEERKIGEIFEHNGEWYQCLKGISCRECDFDINNECDFSTNNVSYDIHGKLLCTRKGRSDETSVVFKKLEKVGEPYIKRISDGTFSAFQRYRVYNSVILPKEPYIYCNFIDGTIEIEIKKNKEDMEENKTTFPKEDNHLTRTVYNYVNGKISDKELIKSIKEMSDEYPYGKNNLKPFDLEAAKAGKPVCTRDGRKARIVCFDKEGSFHLVVLITRKEDLIEDIRTYSVNGISSISYNRRHPEDHNDDLMMLPEKREGGWINIYMRIW